jgi:hypothetical protein
MILKDLQICKSPKNFLLVPDKTQKQQAWNIVQAAARSTCTIEHEQQPVL